MVTLERKTERYLTILIFLVSSFQICPWIDLPDITIDSSGIPWYIDFYKPVTDDF